MTVNIPDPREHLTRYPDRGSDDRAALDALLDDEWTGVLSTVVDGQPWAVPMLFVRAVDEILIHGSTGAGALRHVAAGAPVAFTVMAVDAVVVAHTTFDSSMNYRSAVLRGQLTPVSRERAAELLDAMSDRMLPGRSAEVRDHLPKELAATLAMTLPIEPGQWIYKARSGGVGDEPRGVDAGTTAWAGVVPVVRGFGEPEPAPWNRGDLPASVRALSGQEPLG